MGQLGDTLRTAIIWHCVILCAVLFVLMLLLINFKKFNWLSSGFWVWCSSLAIFVMNPVVTLLTGDEAIYAERLAVTEGTSRIYWTCMCVVVGLGLFYAVYFLRTRQPRSFQWAAIELNWPVILTLTVFVALGLYSVLHFRTDIITHVDLELDDNAHFVGNVNGWQAAMYRFLMFPMVLLILHRRTRWVGVSLLLGTTALRFFDPDDRFTVVTPPMACIIAWLSITKRTWPPMWTAVALLLPTIFLVSRGHMSIDEMSKYPTHHSLDRIRDFFTGYDIDMLSQSYVVGAVYDKYGYTYGVPLIESALFGYLPRNRFPWKDKLFDDLVFKPNERPIVRLLLHPKSTVISDLYSMGGIIAVALGMALLGMAARGLDGMLASTQPVAVRALGYLWMSFSWWLFASALSWNLQYLVLTSMPLAGALAITALWRPRLLFMPASPKRSVEQAALGAR